MADDEGEASKKKGTDLAKLVSRRSATGYQREEIERLERMFRDVPRSGLDSFHIGSLAEMIESQKAIASFAPTLGLMKNDALAQMIEGVRSQQSAFQSAIGAYMDEQRVQAERLKSMINALAIPRFDLATHSIAGALALGETNAFRIAGLTPDYNKQFLSITDALNERLSAFDQFGAATKALALQPDLLGGIGSLLERALAQQASLLEQQQMLLEQTVDGQPKASWRLAEQINMIAAIVAILQFLIFIAVQIESRITGGDPETLENTAAIEENTQTLEEMRGAFNTLADELERMRSTQVEASEEERAAETAMAGILREIADTLTKQEDRQEGGP